MQIDRNPLLSFQNRSGLIRTSSSLWKAKKILLLSCLTAVLFFATAEPDLKGETDPMSQMGVVRLDKAMKAPDFTLFDINGDKRSLSDFNQGFVMLNFWATW